MDKRVMHDASLDFYRRELTGKRITGKLCLEVGHSPDGQLRRICESLQCLKYLELDAVPAPGVDLVCDITHDHLEYCAYGRFGVILCANTLEHIRDWRFAVRVMKILIAPRGLLYLSVPSATGTHIKGYHGYPSDYWRFSTLDLTRLFADFKMIYQEHVDGSLSTENVLAMKPAFYKPVVDLSTINPVAVMMPEDQKRKRKKG
ncbi:MAG: hypothetical protein ACRD5H_00090 [Nitrososphaerales archaeon]